MKKVLLLLAVVSLVLAGCVGPSSYHPYNGDDGYTDIQLNNNLYEVRFFGNAATPKSQVYNMMLYRSSQISLNRGYDYFKVISSRFAHQDEIFTNPGESDTYVTKHKNRKVKTTSYTPPSTTVYTRYTAIMKIRLLKSNRKSGRVYNATTVRNSLSGQISFPRKH